MAAVTSRCAICSSTRASRQKLEQLVRIAYPNEVAPTRLTAVTPYRTFEAEVLRLTPLSPSFLRVTFTGADLDEFADCGFDQRIKLALPLPGAGLDHLPAGPDWYSRWRVLPDHRRNPVRTYTVRAVRRHAREVDVDFVVHGDSGPFSRWANAASVGSRLAIVGPDARFPGNHGGADFRPPLDTRTFLLAGDETAVPAISAILERLPADSNGRVLLEVPRSSDVLAVAAPPRMQVRWLGRDGAPHGSRLVPAMKSLGSVTLRQRFAHWGHVSKLPEPDVDTELLWDVPVTAHATTSGTYAWLAGEAGVIQTLRRHLLSELGVDRRSVAFMGYWRLGRSQIGG